MSSLSARQFSSVEHPCLHTFTVISRHNVRLEYEIVSFVRAFISVETAQSVFLKNGRAPRQHCRAINSETLLLRNPPYEQLL
jgi:hypothetical protein